MDLVKPIITDPLVDDAAETGNPFAIAGAVFFGIVLHPDPLASGGSEYPIGAKPDYEKGLYVQPDKKVEWKIGEDTEPKTRQDCTDSGTNWAFYAPLDNNGRATGVFACLNKGGYNYINDKGVLVATPTRKSPARGQ